MQAPSIFRPKINITYPADNHTLFEEYFFFSLDSTQVDVGRIYIPIFWTSLYVNRGFGRGDTSDIQSYLDSLDRCKKYFTIVQYDDNILNDFGDLDVLIFAQGGYGRYREKCYPIPLNCVASPLAIKSQNKDIFCSFVGAISGRHSIRERLQASLREQEKYLVSEPLGVCSFHDIMNRSLFSLCPRGYGQTSFRICEALQHGSVPVYVYDEPLLPFFDMHNFEEYGVLVHESKIDEINDILSEITPENYSHMVKAGSIAYDDFYSYDGCFRNIIEKMRSS